MFLGHFAVAFAAKRAAPELSLGTTFLAAQFLDLLWPSLLLLGIESVRIAPGATAVTPLVFEHYPYSHSLLWVAGWALLFGLLLLGFRRSVRAALVCALLVLSHWMLDAIVHVPDLPLTPDGNAMVGLGLWQSKPATMALEIPLFAAGLWLYASFTRPLDRVGRWAFASLVVLLSAIYAGNLFGPPPPQVTAIAWVGHAQWLLVAWAWWVDAHRAPGHSGFRPETPA